MPSTQLRPIVEKGMLLVFDSHEPGVLPARVVVFQFNPDTMKRTLTARAAQKAEGEAAAPGDIYRVGGDPTETFTMTVSLHASEQIDPKGDTDAEERGLYPVLAALELLMYPEAKLAREIAQGAKKGKASVKAAYTPLVMLQWGEHRGIVPVKVSGFSVAEEMFDARLNPIQAKVELALQVLSADDLTGASIGASVYQTYIRRKRDHASRYRDAYQAMSRYQGGGDDAGEL